MPHKKQSRKNNQVATPKADTTNDDDFISIIVKSQPSSRNSTLSKKSKRSQEPEAEPEVAPPIPDWEKVGMKEDEFKEMMQRVAKQMREWQVENFKNTFIADLDNVTFWERRIELLEMRRERYNKKRGWSAEDILAVEEIDRELEECEENLDRIEGYDYVEEIY